MTSRARRWHTSVVPDRSSNKDVNQMAAEIVAEATEDGKNPHAVALGRLGGLKGGKARAAKLSAARRKEIAKNAADARWSKRENK